MLIFLRLSGRPAGGFTFFLEGARLLDMHNTYLFNMTFTRADENHANVYHIGYNVQSDRASSVAEAEKILRAHHDHLNVKAVDLFKILDPDGRELARGDCDPRGPRRTVEAVELDENGGLTKVTLSCGHVRGWNQSMQHRVGDQGRCFECRMD